MTCRKREKKRTATERPPAQWNIESLHPSTGL